MRWPWQRVPAAVAPPHRIEPARARVEPPRVLGIAPNVLARSAVPTRTASEIWTIPEAPPGMLPKGAPGMAQDDGISDLYGWAGAYGAMGGVAGVLNEGLGFLGYPYLAQLTQRPEYRRPVEQVAKEMTRKWIKLHAAGEEDKTQKLGEIDAEMKRLGVQDAFRRIAECDGYFGRGQIYIDTGATDNAGELLTPLKITPAKIAIDGIKGFVCVEPLWTYPADYNSTDPLRPDFYKPRSWYAMGRKIDASRMLTFVGREMPDMLKPAYMFGGISLSQLAKAYVDNWLRTRQSVSDLIASFSVSGLSTNLGATLAGAVDTGLMDRVRLFNNIRDNSGTMVIDKETEDFWNVATPLGTLDHLLAQSQEQMASALGIPLVVLLGITPSGLNASSDGEIAVWQAWVEAQQEHLFGPNLIVVIQLVQLNLYGVIDPGITHSWEPLGKLDAVAMAGIRKTEADIAVALVGAGITSAEEERTVLAATEGSPYAGLDVSDLPELPETEEDDPPAKEAA